MFFRKARKENKKKEGEEEVVVKDIEATIEEVRTAVNEFALNLDNGISLRSIVLDTHEIDFELLHSYLGGKPNKPFYMSKETFEVFEDPDYPKHIDHCQIACDQYFLETGEEPIVQGDKTRTISYFKLKNYLVKNPPFELFLDPNDRMVTHRKNSN
ncbi:DUF3939 domain-containing protein [Salipaludibacillus sp. CF4.18]|uniref:DUF3939 domain-containing protein n=1 Tax=Salipaludibacillus sp. CF4.18 TaxID=3373081 RepID=UPI003EE61531